MFQTPSYNNIGYNSGLGLSFYMEHSSTQPSQGVQVFGVYRKVGGASFHNCQAKKKGYWFQIIPLQFLFLFLFGPHV